MTSSRKDVPRARAGSRVASKASKVLSNPKSSSGAKSVAASALTRTANKGSKGNATTVSPKGPASAARSFLRSRAEEQRASTKNKSWRLQDAKARFSELVRRVKAEGPQHVTVHGREEVVVMSADEFRRLKGEQTGAALIAAMQASPSREIDIAPNRASMPVRTLDL